MCYDVVTRFLGDPLIKSSRSPANPMNDEIVVHCGHYDVSVEQCTKISGKKGPWWDWRPKTIHMLRGKLVCDDVRRKNLEERHGFCTTCKQRMDDDPFLYWRLSTEDQYNVPSPPPPMHITTTTDKAYRAAQRSEDTTKATSKKDERKKKSSRAATAPQQVAVPIKKEDKKKKSRAATAPQAVATPSSSRRTERTSQPTEAAPRAWRSWVTRLRHPKPAPSPSTPPSRPGPTRAQTTETPNMRQMYLDDYAPSSRPSRPGTSRAQTTERPTTRQMYAFRGRPQTSYERPSRPFDEWTEW